MCVFSLLLRLCRLYVSRLLVSTGARVARRKRIMGTSATARRNLLGASARTEVRLKLGSRVSPKAESGKADFERAGHGLRKDHTATT